MAVWDSLTEVFSVVGAAIITALVAVWDSISSGASSAISAISGFASSAWSAISGFVSGAATALADWVASGATAAWDWIKGICQGIANGVGSVVSAVKGLASSAVSAFSSATESHSPSRLFQRKGAQIPQGVALGVTEGQPLVSSALSTLVSPSDMAPANSQSTTVSSSKGGNTYHVTINAPSGDAGDIKATLEAWLVGTLEATAIQLGGGEVPQAA